MIINKGYSMVNNGSFILDKSLGFGMDCCKKKKKELT